MSRRIEKKLDQWDDFVHKQFEKGTYLSWSTVARLLRQEHRRVVRMVRNILCDYQSSDGDTAAENAIKDILTKLKERA